MELLGIPTLKFLHIENSALKTTGYFCSFKKSRKRFSKFPEVPF